MDAVQLVGVLVAELAGDDPADVAAPAAYFSYPSVPVISVCQRSATFQKLASGKPVSGPGKPKPGKDGTMTSNASAGSPPYAAGSASGPITFDQCQNVHGQPWVRISGIGRGPRPGSRMKYTGTPSTLTRYCSWALMAASAARQS